MTAYIIISAAVIFMTLGMIWPPGLRRGLAFASGIELIVGACIVFLF